jgi:hypothetical protein
MIGKGAEHKKIITTAIAVVMLICGAGAIAGAQGTPPAAVNQPAPPQANPVPLPVTPPGAAVLPSGAAVTPPPPAITPTNAKPASAPTAAADPMQDEQMRVNIQNAFDLKSKLHKPEISPQEFRTLFFTPWQYALLQEAKRGFLSRPPSARELQGNQSAPRPPGLHEISLGGVVYKTPKNWTIWLNGERVTPDSLPEQVLDLKVADDHIDLKWFDSSRNLIYPIRMRPHQRFNLDSRIFLPGIGTQ